MELKLSLSVVSEPTVQQGSTYDGIRADWSFKSTYGANLFSSCPLARLSKVYVDVTSNIVTPKVKIQSSRFPFYRVL